MKLFTNEAKVTSIPGSGSSNTIPSIEVSVGFDYQKIKKNDLEKYGIKDWYMGSFFIVFNPPVALSKISEDVFPKLRSISAEDSSTVKVLQQIEDKIQIIIKDDLSALGSEIQIEFRKGRYLENLANYYGEKEVKLGIFKKSEIKDDNFNQLIRDLTIQSNILIEKARNGELKSDLTAAEVDTAINLIIKIQKGGEKEFSSSEIKKLNAFMQKLESGNLDPKFTNAVHNLINSLSKQSGPPGGLTF